MTLQIPVSARSSRNGALLHGIKEDLGKSRDDLTGLTAKVQNIETRFENFETLVQAQN